MPEDARPSERGSYIATGLIVVVLLLLLIGASWYKATQPSHTKFAGAPGFGPNWRCEPAPYAAGAEVCDRTEAPPGAAPARPRSRGDIRP